MANVVYQRVVKDETSTHLGQLRPANTTAASIYTPGDGVIALIDSIVVCNTGAGPCLYRIFHDDDGTTYDQSTALYYDISLATKMAVVLEPGIYMANGSGNLAVRTNTANDLTFTVYGRQIQVRAR